jgi:hypothetical protein
VSGKVDKGKAIGTEFLSQQRANKESARTGVVMKEESGREAPEIMTGRTPYDQALEPPSVTTFAPLRFDAREFMHLVEDEGLTEDEAMLLLRAIWEVMVSFLDLQLGIHPISHVVDGSTAKNAGARQERRSMVTSRPALSKTAGRKTVAPRRRTRKDS